MEYYSAIEKKKVLSFLTTWVDLEHIMLSEISQRKANTAWSHLYLEYKIVKLIEAENSMVVTRVWGRGIGEMLVKGHKVSTVQNE